MADLVTLQELEAYRQEQHFAARDGRIPKYKDPRAVYAEDPNREGGFLVELTEEELADLEKARIEADKADEENAQAVLDALQENGNVDVAAPLADPNTAGMTEEQAQALVDQNALHNDGPVTVSGNLDNPAQAPSIAPEESIVPSPGTVTGAPEPNQSIVEAQSILANQTNSAHPNLQDAPNPEFVGGNPAPEETTAAEVPAPVVPELGTENVVVGDSGTVPAVINPGDGNSGETQATQDQGTTPPQDNSGDASQTTSE